VASDVMIWCEYACQERDSGKSALPGLHQSTLSHSFNDRDSDLSVSLSPMDAMEGSHMA
jgi:hypothetical protein